MRSRTRLGFALTIASNVFLFFGWVIPFWFGRFYGNRSKTQWNVFYRIHCIRGQCETISGILSNAIVDFQGAEPRSTRFFCNLVCTYFHSEHHNFVCNFLYLFIIPEFKLLFCTKFNLLDGTESILKKKSYLPAAIEKKKPQVILGFVHRNFSKNRYTIYNRFRAAAIHKVKMIASLHRCLNPTLLSLHRCLCPKPLFLHCCLYPYITTVFTLTSLSSHLHRVLYPYIAASTLHCCLFHYPAISTPSVLSLLYTALSTATPSSLALQIISNPTSTIQ